MRRGRPGSSGERGFTLIEVVVALGLLAAVLAAVTALFTQLLKSSAEIDRREYAVTLAQRQMELVRGVDARFVQMGGGSRTGLVAGRALTDVAALNADAASLGSAVSTAVASTNVITPTGDAQGADPRVTGSTSVNPAIDLRRTDGAAEASNIPAQYVTRTFIGTCELPYKLGEKQVVTDAEACVQDVTSLPGPRWGVVTLVRVVIAVSWNTAGCTPADCVVSLQSLIDPNTNSAIFTDLETTADEPVWTASTLPSVTTDYETPVTLSPLTILKFGTVTWTNNQAKIIEWTQQIRIDSPPQSLTDPDCASSTATPGESTIEFVPAEDCWGTVTFSYTMVDVWGRAPTGIVTASVDVRPPPPVAVADNATTTWPTAVTVPVLANDTLASGVTYSISGLTQPAAGRGGAVVSGQSVLYTPPLTWPGGASFLATFNYTVNDTYGQSSSTTVTVTVNRPPAPIARDDNASTTWPNPVTIDVLANDTRVVGLTYTITGLSTPNRGTAALSGSNVVYTPPRPWPGGGDFDAVFTYTMGDATGQTSTATVTVRVNRPTPPVARDDSASTVYRNAVTIDVLANDTKVAGIAYTVASVTTPVPGGAVGVAGNQVVFTPMELWPGGSSYVASFDYTMRDETGQASTATVTVTVNRPAPPVAANDSASTVWKDPVTIAVQANDTLVAGLIYTMSVTQPSQGSAVVSGTNVIYTPPDANPGGTITPTFTYTVTDPTGQSSTATVTVTVTVPKWTPPNLAVCAPYNGTVVVPALSGAYGVTAYLEIANSTSTAGPVRPAANPPATPWAATANSTGAYRATVTGSNISILGQRNSTSVRTRWLFYAVQYTDGTYATAYIQVDAKTSCP